MFFIYIYGHNLVIFDFFKSEFFQSQVRTVDSLGDVSKHV